MGWLNRAIAVLTITAAALFGSELFNKKYPVEAPSHVKSSTRVGVANVLAPDFFTYESSDSMPLLSEEQILEKVKNSKEIWGSGDTMFMGYITASGLKPEGMELYNPLREEDPPEVSEDYLLENPNSKLTEKTRKYWNMRITELDADEMKKCDVIFSIMHFNHYLTNENRKKLDEYVREGGFLWIDNCANLRTFNFISDVRTLTEKLYPDEGRPKGQRIVKPNHPLIRGYYDLNKEDIDLLGCGPASWSFITEYDNDFWETLVEFEFEKNNFPAVLLAKYGDGHILFTSNHINWGGLDPEEEYIGEPYPLSKKLFANVLDRVYKSKKRD